MLETFRIFTSKCQELSSSLEDTEHCPLIFWDIYKMLNFTLVATLISGEFKWLRKEGWP